MTRVALLLCLFSAFSTPVRASAQRTTLWCELEVARPVTSLRAPSCGLGSEAPLRSCRGFGGAGVPTEELARQAWRLAEQTLAAETLDPAAVREALVRLEALRLFAPELSDRIALFGAELEQLLGATPATCSRYAEAIESPLPSVAARARVGRVRCLLETGDRDGEEALIALERRYQELPMRTSLHLALGQAREGWGRTLDAIATYRTIDIEHPGSSEASEARDRLSAMVARGVRIRGLTPTQEVERAERLVRSGPPDLARTEISRLRGAHLATPLAAEVALLAARLARVEGRFDDAHMLMREARGLEPAVGDDPVAVENVADDLADAATARDREEAASSLRRMGFSRSLRRQSATRLYMMARVASRAGMEEELHALLDEEIRRVDRGTESCVGRFDLAIVSEGTADDARIARLLEGCEGSDARGVAARYHRARALERLGRVREARRELRRVVRDDPSDTGFYTLWASTRLTSLASAPPDNPFDPEADSDGDPPPIDALPVDAPPIDALPIDAPPIDAPPIDDRAIDALPVVLASWSGVPWRLEASAEAAFAAPDAAELLPALGLPTFEPTPDTSSFDDASDAAPEPIARMSDEQISDALARLATVHGDAFPWLARARALVRVGARADAAEELFFVYEAAREAGGGSPLRSGLEAVYRGASPARIASSLVLRRDRRRLSSSDRRALADVAASLGDYGLSTRFGGPGRAAARPRPFEPVVRAAAARHGLDPNLLWAVMRVESVFNPAIVSYAGAIGLMQIMPRTGRNIAHHLGMDGFTPADLLDPTTNIELSAWYLASLLERFEGRIPLAIAAYNGGPHNVRRWMEDHGRDLPVDALCERIPFDQTFRYVRRVLHHYAAYRALDGLSLPLLEPTMPGASIDRVAF